MRKVKYVGIWGADHLTNGKVYDVIKSQRPHYPYITICNDIGDVFDYPMVPGSNSVADIIHFIDVTAEYRNDIISSILE